MRSIVASFAGSNRGLSAFGGYETKKVSCMSRAGCCCGTKRASKFQKPVSTKLVMSVGCALKSDPKTYCPVGISTKPCEKKMLRNSCLTLFRGCNAPASWFAPSAAKLYGLKFAVFHASFVSSSAVRSVCSTGISFAYFGPFVMVYVMTLVTVTSFFFFSWARSFASSSDCVSLMPCSNWRVVSAGSSVWMRTRLSPSFLIHLFLKPLPCPTLATSFPKMVCVSCQSRVASS